MRFSGRHILITGGTSGIGLAGARGIAADGGTVVVTGRSPQRAERAQAALPDGVRIITNDAASPETGRELRDALGEDRRLDGIWFNAGQADLSPIDAVTPEFFDRLMHANVRGPMLQLAALADLLADGAAIVLTASTSAYERAPLTSVYSATKGAMLSLARCWAEALAPRGIRVNTIVPGPIATGLRDFLPDATRSAFETEVIGQVPLGRIGMPEESAAVALFLLSDAASYVTGSQYAVDGGMLMR